MALLRLSREFSAFERERREKRETQPRFHRKLLSGIIRHIYYPFDIFVPVQHLYRATLCSSAVLTRYTFRSSTYIYVYLSIDGPNKRHIPYKYESLCENKGQLILSIRNERSLDRTKPQSAKNIRTRRYIELLPNSIRYEPVGMLSFFSPRKNDVRVFSHSFHKHILFFYSKLNIQKSYCQSHFLA